MHYSIRHVTHLEYETPIRESVMEVRVCPRSEAQQQCYSHELTVSPHAPIFSYQDSLGNIVHHFNIPGVHDFLRLESRAIVEVQPPPPLPDSLPVDTWAEIDEMAANSNLVEMVLPSRFSKGTPRLHDLATELGVERRTDPLTLLLETNEAVFTAFEYSPASTHVHSPIDDALEMRRGVCQDFAHIFSALGRSVGIPCRYVSGYLHHRSGADGDRSAEDGSHAWVEAFLGHLGWVGFDPTNRILAGERHIRVAVGRDYADVPPNRGMYKGESRSALRVGVHVAQATYMSRDDEMPELTRVTQGEELDSVDGEPAEAAAANDQ